MAKKKKGFPLTEMEKHNPLTVAILRKEKTLSYKDFAEAYGPRYLIYDVGYRQALMDVISWFDTPGAVSFCKDLRINQKVLLKILRLFLECENRFQRENYSFKVFARQIFNEKGKKEWGVSAPFGKEIYPEVD